MISKLLLSAAANQRLEELVSSNRLTRGLVRRYVAGTPITWQTFGGGRAPGANDTTGSLAGAQRQVSGRFVKENPPSA